MLGIRLIGLGILVETLSLMQERLLLKRSLPSSSIKKEYHQYEVIKSIDNVRSGPAELGLGKKDLVYSTSCLNLFSIILIMDL